MVDYTARTTAQGGAAPANVQPVDFGLAEIAGTIRKRMTEARDQEDEALAFKLTTDARLAISKTIREREKAATGTAAGHADGLDRDWEQLSEPWLKQAPGRVRPMVERRLAQFRESALIGAMDFETKKAEAETLRNVKSTLDLAANGIRSNPETYGATIAELEGMVASAGLGEDLGDALITEAKATYTSMYVRGLGDRDPYAAKRALNSGELDDKLTPALKDQLLNAADADIKRREAEARQAQREKEQAAAIERQIAAIGMQDDIKSDIASIVDTGTASDIDPMAVRATMGEKDFVKWTEARAQAFKLHEVTTGYAGLPRDEIEARVAELEPTPGSPNYAQDKAIHEAAREAAGKVLEARASDPAGVIQTLAPVQAAAAAVDSADDASRPAAMTAYLRAMDAAYSEAYIAPSSRRYMSAAQAKATAAEFNQPSPDRGQMMRDRLMGLAATYGDKFPSVLDQLVKAGLPKDAVAFAQIADDPDLATEFARGLSAAPQLDTILAPATKTVITRSAGSGLEAFDAAVSRSPNGLQLQEAARTIQTVTAHARIADGADASTAMRDAAEAFSARYDYAGSIMVPVRTGLEASDVADVLKAELDTLTPADLLGYGSGEIAAKGGQAKDNQGFPIDLSRPILKNEDGTISTEVTIGVEMDGRIYNIPTIVDGKRVSQDVAIADARKKIAAGAIYPNFATEAEAETAAADRSALIGQLRATPDLTYSPFDTADTAAEALRDSLYAEGGASWVLYGKEEGLALVDANGLPVRRRDGTPIRYDWPTLQMKKALSDVAPDRVPATLSGTFN